MALKRRNKRKLDFNSSSMSDLVFLLLIFFMLTSTLVAPNAIKLLLPNSNSRTMAKQTVTVYINDKMDYFIGEKPVSESQLQTEINIALGNTADGTVVVRSDKTVPVQYVVNVIDAVNNINNETHQNHKVLLATSSKK
ncbi:MAG: ExbD/TolR family protein [Candidatus Limimorpha sp.]|nr:biopolymer transporter ExbD [Bacteroidales bacterium]MCI7377550.1 biopolymer transporter ExbD [Bacteroidales bacterium]MDD5978487.1 biopolymer transporter ExbD [Bacteroidales bacterium]MDD7277285.1 biopolymer transporter ExbD [Bacteroidales bacterium]MDY6075083.1 biopolymer transporter ExbD [Bacteroidales bacterium]